MVKRIITIVAMLALTSTLSMAQWANLGAWPDDTYTGYGTHGIAVSPDGKLWTVSILWRRLGNTNWRYFNCCSNLCI